MAYFCMRATIVKIPMVRRLLPESTCFIDPFCGENLFPSRLTTTDYYRSLKSERWWPPFNPRGTSLTSYPPDIHKMPLSESVPEASADDPLAIFEEDPKNFDDLSLDAEELWEAKLNRLLKAVLGWGVDQNMDGMIHWHPKEVVAESLVPQVQVAIAAEVEPDNSDDFGRSKRKRIP